MAPSPDAADTPGARSGTDTGVQNRPAAARQRRPVTIITGGSEGIGFELARCFAARGQDIIVIARDEDKLREAAKALKSKLAADGNAQIDISPLPLDLTAPTALAQLDAALAARGAYADIVINNAGIGLSGEFTSHNPDEIETLLQLNINVLTRLMRHVLPGMTKRGRGGVLNVASLGGFGPGPYQAAYYASKAYVISLSEATNAELRHSGVRICALAPGPVRTHFHAQMGSQNDFYYRFLPVLSARRVAKAGYLGFMWRKAVIVPGIMNNLLALSLRLTPHPIVLPIMGLLLRPRQTGRKDA